MRGIKENTYMFCWKEHIEVTLISFVCLVQSKRNYKWFISCFNFLPSKMNGAKLKIPSIIFYHRRKILFWFASPSTHRKQGRQSKVDGLKLVPCLSPRHVNMLLCDTL